MERNETTVCEKLFNAFHMHPSFRPLRRLTFRQQPDHAAAAVAPSPPSLAPDRPKSHSSDGSDLSSPPPQSPPAPKPKPPAAVATAKVDTLRPQPMTPAPSASVPKERAQQLPSVLSKAGPNPTQAANNIPASTAPAEVARGSSRSIVEMAAASEAAVSQPGPEKARRNVNDKAEEYIAKARRKMRTVTGVGRTPSSK